MKDKKISIKHWFNTSRGYSPKSTYMVQNTPWTNAIKGCVELIRRSQDTTQHQVFVDTASIFFGTHKMIKTSFRPEEISACTEIEIFWLINWKSHGCPNTGRRIDRTVNFYRAAHNICGFSVRNLIYVTFLPPRCFRSFLEFWKCWHPWITPVICLKVQEAPLLGHDTKSWVISSWRHNFPFGREVTAEYVRGSSQTHHLQKNSGFMYLRLSVIVDVTCITF
jgi:hypothetical protein